MLLKAANDNQLTRIPAWFWGIAACGLVCSLVISLAF
jgi:hypothetical protein